MQNKILINGIPESLGEGSQAVIRSRVHRIISDIIDETGIKDLNLTISTTSSKTPKVEPQTKQTARDELSLEERASQYKAKAPLYDFDQLVVSKDIENELLLLIEATQVESTVLEDWGLKKIEPFFHTALNFYGSPGTGKTLAAHALAQKIGKNIITASYAQIESKFVGEGPKNIEAVFYAAQRDNAILFIDEADSLLSRRLTNVTSGSEQAINSLRSQLLICLEQFRGIVIFATNLVENYDKAFESRVYSIQFTLPDEEARKKIWQVHFPKELPLAKEVSIDELAKLDNLSGRQIKQAVIFAAIQAALRAKRQGQLAKNGSLQMSDLLLAVHQIKKSSNFKQWRELTDSEKEEITKKIKTYL